MRPPKFSNFIPAIGWLILVTHLLTLPGNQFPQTNWPKIPHGDKIVHAILFAVLAGLFYLPYLRRGFEGFSVSKGVAIGVLVTAYGLLMEYIQLYHVASRSFEWWDVVADGIGAFLPLLWFWKKIRRGGISIVISNSPGPS